jgi:hypothetical protein
MTFFKVDSYKAMKQGYVVDMYLIRCHFSVILNETVLIIFFPRMCYTINYTLIVLRVELLSSRSGSWFARQKATSTARGQDVIFTSNGGGRFQKEVFDAAWSLSSKFP